MRTTSVLPGHSGRERGRWSRSPEARFPLALAGIAAAALMLRVANVLWWRPSDPSITEGTLRGDAFFYHWQGRALAEGHGYIDPGAWRFLDVFTPSAAHPPGYSTFLGVWSWFGVDSITGHRLVSSLLGVGTVVIIGVLARRLAGDRAGLLAAGLAAVYPMLWINDGMLLSESLASLSTALFLLLAYRFRDQPGYGAAALLGASIGLCALSRTEVVLLFPAVAVPFALLVREKPWPTRIGMAGVCCVVGGLVLAPWALFNLGRFEEPVTMTSGTGAALSAGACDEVWEGPLLGYYAACFDTPFPGADPELAAALDADPDNRELRAEYAATVDESERDVAPNEEAQAYYREHKSRIPVVVAARVARVWGLWSPQQLVDLDADVENRGRAASWAAQLMYYVLLPFGVLGVVALWRRRQSVLPVLALAGVVTFAAVITFGVTRYRATFEPALVLVAAIGVDALLRRWAVSRRQPAREAGTSSR
jgi:4-amino-4-deoxy-L-arabinose transferase-like glycosyltransferase